jgi:5-methylcytosine-specific restriction endonuclease McrA
MRLGRKYGLDEILPLLDPNRGSRAASIDGYTVKVSTLRLCCFKRHGWFCAGCGIVAAYFTLEQPLGANQPHLQLYALDNNEQEVLMTHDHIIALADGGSNSLENAQTMCRPCNVAKDSESARRTREAQKAAAKKLREEKKNERMARAGGGNRPDHEASER